MTENVRSNSAMNDENIGYGDKWHEQDGEDLLNLLEKGSVNIEDLVNKLRLLQKIKIERPEIGEEEHELFVEIKKLSNENVAKNAVLVALKKCPNPFIVGVYLYYLREIGDLLAARYPVEKVFDVVGEIDSKTIFDVIKEENI